MYISTLSGEANPADESRVAFGQCDICSMIPIP